MYIANYLLGDLFDFRYSKIIGSTDIKIIATITSEKWSLTDGMLPKKIPRQDKGERPNKSTKHVVAYKFSVMHLPHPRHKRGKSADYWDKPRKKNCLPAMLFVKFFEFCQCVLGL